MPVVDPPRYYMLSFIENRRDFSLKSSHQGTRHRGPHFSQSGHDGTSRANAPETTCCQRETCLILDQSVPCSLGFPSYFDSKSDLGDKSPGVLLKYAGAINSTRPPRLYHIRHPQLKGVTVPEALRSPRECCDGAKHAHRMPRFVIRTLHFRAC